ncbi:MAG: tetratricopeptide repeat protein [Nocardioides sp.]
MKFCPECGEKLEANQKFCPNCGSKVKKEDNQTKNYQEPQKTEAKKDVNFCPNCGEENPSDAVICESCGIKLREGKPVAPVKKQVHHSKKETAAKSGSAEKSNDEIDKTKVIYVGLGILAILMFVLYSSGVFDTVPTGQVNNVTAQPDASSGVNLANMQRINELENQVKANPEDAHLLLELAHLKNDSGLYENAILDYKKYLQTHEDDPDARIDMGVCYYNLRQYDQAKAEMQKALEYKPDHQIGHLNLGIVNLASGNLEESKKWLNKAVSLNPDNEIGKKAQELLQSH